MIGILAILGIFKVEGMTRQMYETLRKDVDWEHNHPKGLIFHSSAFGDSGNNFHVVDLWESEKDLNDFFSGRLMQSMRDNKIPEPKREIYQINDVSAFLGIDKFRV